MAATGAPATSNQKSLRPLLVPLAVSGFVFSACLSFADLTGGDGGATEDDASRPGDASIDHRSNDGPGDAGDSGSTSDCGAFPDPATSSISDSFDGGSLSSNWFVPMSSHCAAQTGGALVAQPSSDEYCLFFTAQVFHLTCSSVTVKVPEATVAARGVQTVMYLDHSSPDGGMEQIALILESGGFEFGFAGNATSGIGPYDAAKDVWWRLRESGGTLFFDTAPDGKTWTERGSTPETFPLDDVTIVLGAGQYKSPPVANAGAATFRCYNLPPESCQ